VSQSPELVPQVFPRIDATTTHSASTPHQCSSGFGAGLWCDEQSDTRADRESNQ
jgi:hypothetical protein